ncbi:tetratricopeptide (TPR) repeat protein [Pseudorhizobium tarimense]|uniref:Tetratricopeptide (TPR) repeat protein n=1 Tax=Pseudorhizobium tarimense TaxID=1079109 RepID=A0ABV2H464_9HYPH|nr:tetratricopeptide repeat protein [Pseudorhizobium tarimense]MCJ8518577.1 tetratricopeptide repeat protein [Pseudorhizobium tarimense]
MISIEDRLAAADAHREKGRVDSALMLYQLVLDVNPRNCEALKAVARIYAEQGRLAEALEAIGFVVAMVPDDVDGLTLLASYAEGAGDSARAAAALDQIVLLDPDGSSTALLRANRAADEGNFPAAERILVDALRQEPKNTAMIMALSRLYFAGGMSEDALSLAERAVSLAPEDGACLSLLASQLVTLGDHRGAIECYERALLAAPVDLVALVGLVECHASCGELSEARRLASRAIALRPDLLPAWRAYVRVEILRGEWETALKRFNEVARAHAKRVDALICLADCYRLAGDHAACLKLLQPLVGRSSLTPLQIQMADSLRRESALALGDFEAVLASVPGLDVLAASLVADEYRPVTVSIPATTTITEVMPLLRLTHLPKVERPVSWTGLDLFSDIASLAPGVAFKPVEPGQPVPPGLPLPALIGLADISAETLAAAIPYIEAPTDRREIWRAALAEFPRPHIALAWNASRPGLMLDDLAPILEGFPGTFIAVVWDEGRHQLRAFPQVIDAGAEITGLADVAAVLAESDLVLGPDCLPLHLAGAMGARGLALMQPDANWYWHERDSRSAWYPSIEVVRTQRVGHWAVRREDIIDSVGRRLTALTKDDGANPEDEEKTQREVA